MNGVNEIKLSPIEVIGNNIEQRIKELTSEDVKLKHVVKNKEFVITVNSHLGRNIDLYA